MMTWCGQACFPVATGLLVAGMVVAGILGGWVNLILAQIAGSDEDSGSTTQPAGYKFMIMGIAAAFAVPVFFKLANVGTEGDVIQRFLLKFASDNQADQGESISALLVILGFCVIAAVSAPKFLKTISDRVLQETREKAKNATERAAEATDRAEATATKAKELAELLDGVKLMTVHTEDVLDRLREEEADSTVEDQEDDTAESEPEPGEATPSMVEESLGLDETNRKILQALARKPNVRRSIKGIKDDSDLTGPLRGRLESLHRMGYVRKLPSIKGSTLPRWKLDAKGWVEVGGGNSS